MPWVRIFAGAREAFSQLAVGDASRPGQGSTFSVYLPVGLDSDDQQFVVSPTESEGFGVGQ